MLSRHQGLQNVPHRQIDSGLARSCASVSAAGTLAYHTTLDALLSLSALLCHSTLDIGPAVLSLVRIVCCGRVRMCLLWFACACFARRPSSGCALFALLPSPSVVPFPFPAPAPLLRACVPLPPVLYL